MRKNNLGIFVLLVACGMVGTVRSQDDSVEEIRLGVGESRTIGDNGFQIGFDEILSDSRCPEDVICIWEGDAVAQLWADQSPSEKIVLELHTHHGFPWQIRLHDYLITLIDVTPYPRTDEVIDPQEYVIILSVMGIHASAEHSTWGRMKNLFR